MSAHPIYVDFVHADCTCQWTDVRPVSGQAATIMKMVQRDPHCAAYASDRRGLPPVFEHPRRETAVSRDEVAAMIEAAVGTLRQELLAQRNPMKKGIPWVEHAADCNCQWSSEGDRTVLTYTDSNCRVTFIGPEDP